LNVITEPPSFISASCMHLAYFLERI
jgi:hypothetical protein